MSIRLRPGIVRAACIAQQCSISTERLGENCLNILLDTYIRVGVYTEHGIDVRNYCGAEPPRDTGPAGLVRTVGGRDRAPASHVAADGVKAPARAARRRFRGGNGGRT